MFFIHENLEMLLYRKINRNGFSLFHGLLKILMANWICQVIFIEINSINANFRLKLFVKVQRKKAHWAQENLHPLQLWIHCVDLAQNCSKLRTTW
jgi:hypothetical protein